MPGRSSGPTARSGQGAGQVVQVGEHRLMLRNLDKVLYPATGTTKGEVLAYYTAVAEAMLAHVRHRPVTRKRWPDGVDGPSFFEKNLPNGTPGWVRRVRLPVPGSMRDRETIMFPLDRRPRHPGLDGEPRRAGDARAAVDGPPGRPRSRGTATRTGWSSTSTRAPRPGSPSAPRSRSPSGSSWPPTAWSATR